LPADRIIVIGIPGHLKHMNTQEYKLMSNYKSYFRAVIGIGLFTAMLTTMFGRVPEAIAVPSYARQTGLACKS